MNNHEKLAKLKEENSQLKYEIDEINDVIKHYEYNRKAEVWLKCYVGLLVYPNTSLNNIAEITDEAVKEYWSRFK